MSDATTNPTVYFDITIDDAPAGRITFELFADGTGSGDGPAHHHERFRTWKEDLRDHA